MKMVGKYVYRDGAFFFLAKPSPVEPVVGMTVRTYGLSGQSIRGVFLNGVQVYYRTKEDEYRRHKEQVIADKIKKKAEFVFLRPEYERKIAALPEIFQLRIKKFQDANPDYDWEFGSYELFCCEQAWVFVTSLGTSDALLEWAKLPYEKQMEQVPVMSDGHISNTFGMSVRLAHHYLTDRENVVREHGSLTPLVGCKEFGCLHPDSKED